MTEIWKDIKGFEGLYEISPSGIIKSVRRLVTNNLGYTYFIGGEIKKASKNNHGYLTVSLYNDGIRYACTVHRLVAINFIPNPDNLPEVNHENGNKECCEDWNLTWSSKANNTQHAIDNELYRYGSRHYRSKPIINLNTGIFYECIRDAAESAGFSNGYLKQNLRVGRINRTPFIYA